MPMQPSPIRETIAPCEPSFTFCMLMPLRWLGVRGVSFGRSGDGGVDRTRDPCGGFGDEAVEEGAGCGADVVAALGMPLYAEDEVGGGAFGSLTAFDGFDDGILRTAGGDAEAVAGDADGLMVAGVDGQAEEVVLLGSFVRSEEGAEERL